MKHFLNFVIYLYFQMVTASDTTILPLIYTKITTNLKENGTNKNLSKNNVITKNKVHFYNLKKKITNFTFITLLQICESNITSPIKFQKKNSIKSNKTFDQDECKYNAVAQFKPRSAVQRKVSNEKQILTSESLLMTSESPIKISSSLTSVPVPGTWSCVDNLRCISQNRHLKKLGFLHLIML